MKNIIITSLLVLIICTQGKSQLSNDYNAGDTSYGLTFSRTSIRNASVDKMDPSSKYAYFGIGVDVIHNAYEKGEFRYLISSKALTTDLIHYIVTIINDTENDVRLNMSGFFWGKLGFNILETDNFSIGIGASLADYIINIPKWRPTINTGGGTFDYDEPTGWHLSAGPSLFLDYALGDFVINSVSTYNLGFIHTRPGTAYGGVPSSDIIENYANPHFLSTALYINHTNTGLYLSFEYNKMIDKGIIQNNLSRKEIAIGWIMDFSFL